MTTDHYRVGDYLMDRLAELGIDRIFGVPGDYSLGLLDHVVHHPTVRWTGCSNELNAGYAADGYARLRGTGALITTFGVGELSAINAISGSFAEFVPVIHVVGAPATAAQAAHRLVHHTLGDGIFTHFARMHSDITCAQGILTAANATQEIDRVLTTARDRRLPGYLLLPADVAEAQAVPPAEPLPSRVRTTDPEVLAAFTDAAGRLLAGARSAREVCVLAGLLVHRFGAAPVLTDLLAAGPVPRATSLWAKSLLDESNPLFVGTYAGAASDDLTRRTVEESAALIVAGVQFTDLNTGLFSQHITRTRTIEIGAGTASVGAATFAPVELGDALAALIPLVAALTHQSADGPDGPPVGAPLGEEPAESKAQPPPSPPEQACADQAPAEQAPAERAPALQALSQQALSQQALSQQALSQQALWDAVTDFLRPGDIVLADQGTSFYGMGTHRLPAGVTFVGQPLWASIGYTLPALLGACLARAGRRGVLLIGDGAAQMTIQELGTIFRHQLPAVIIVVDNDGYTVERAIHGPAEPYNDIARWDWTMAPAFFGAGSGASVQRAGTLGELRDALDDAQHHADRLTLIQAVVPALDVPELLDTLARSLGGGAAQTSSH